MSEYGMWFRCIMWDPVPPGILNEQKMREFNEIQVRLNTQMAQIEAERVAELSELSKASSDPMPASSFKKPERLSELFRHHGPWPDPATIGRILENKELGEKYMSLLVRFDIRIAKLQVEKIAEFCKLSGIPMK